MDEGGADTGVAVATEQRVGVADGTLAVLVDVVVAAAVSVEGGGVVQDVGHAVGKWRGYNSLPDSWSLL